MESILEFTQKDIALVMEQCLCAVLWGDSFVLLEHCWHVSIVLTGGTPWVLVGASNSGHSMIACNIFWFVLDLWPSKILAPTWPQICFLFVCFYFQKGKQQYWDKLNEVKTPWVLVGSASSKHIKSATFIRPLIYCALALRKCLENY